MKKYLGASIGAFAAIVMPLLGCLALLLGIGVISSGVDAARVFVFIGCVLAVFVECLWVKEIANQIYSWGQFSDDHVLVKTLFAKSCSIAYAKCFGCGIGYYTHGILNSQGGTKIYYIFLSYDKFDEQYRSKINLWRPTKTRIKVGFSKELYEYLAAVLPKAQAQMLIQDYKKYFG